MTKNNALSSYWREEIIRETDHYYQGEMQQEERASWLLGTASALVAIFISLYITSVDKGIIISNTFIFAPLIAFFISAMLAILGLLPFGGTKLFKMPSRKKINMADQDLDKFISNHFSPDSLWDELSLNERILHHFRSHYIRNYRKSRWVIYSSGFLLLGLFGSIACFLCLIH